MICQISSCAAPATHLLRRSPRDASVACCVEHAKAARALIARALPDGTLEELRAPTGGRGKGRPPLPGGLTRAKTRAGLYAAASKAKKAGDHASAERLREQGRGMARWEAKK